MIDLEQLGSLALIIYTNTGHDVALEDAYRIAHAIINAGWTPPPTITAETCCPNPMEVEFSTYEDLGRFPNPWVCGCRPHCNLAVEPIP